MCKVMRHPAPRYILAILLANVDEPEVPVERRKSGFTAGLGLAAIRP